MRIIGIDPGFNRLGAAVMEIKKKKERLLFSDCFSTPSALSFPERLTKLAAVFERWLEKYRPRLLIIEQLFFSANRKTALRVAEVRGLILYLAAKRKLSILELTPVEVKAMISGYGRADKKQMTVIVQKILGLKSGGKKSYDDEFDAIAIALAGGLKNKMLSTLR